MLSMCPSTFQFVHFRKITMRNIDSTWQRIKQCCAGCGLKCRNRKCKWKFAGDRHWRHFEYQFVSVVREIQQRYVLTFMAFSALCNAHAMRTNLSMAITRMVCYHARANTSVCPVDEDVELIPFGVKLSHYSPVDEYNFFETEMHNFQWSQEMQGIILSSFYWGYVLAHLPGGLLAHKYGGKYILAFGIFFSGVLSLLIPVCVNYGGAHSLIAIRMLMGICQGPIVPASLNLFSSWIPFRERCTMLSLMQSGISVSHQRNSSFQHSIWLSMVF